MLKPLMVSIMGPLMNKVKLCIVHPKKNKRLATKLRDTVNLLSE